jgi:hypothetical protein
MCDQRDMPSRVHEPRPLPCLFRLGSIVATRGALDLLDRAGVNASDLLTKHVTGDWGVVSLMGAAANLRAVGKGSRVMSAYDLGQNHERLWIITESDRSLTTLLMPNEY